MEGILPANLLGLSQSQIENSPVRVGNKFKELSSVFKVNGVVATEDPVIEFHGDLTSFNKIGGKLSCGEIVVHGSVGSNVGQSMSGGKLHVEGNAGNFAGSEMTGGKLLIDGNSGDFAGANCPGSKFGMNRGLLVIRGNAGKSLGRRMRRGTIIVHGDVGSELGWEMLAGTVITFGRTGFNIGLEMRRGTIILAGDRNSKTTLNSRLQKGLTYRPQLFPMIFQWLKNEAKLSADISLLQQIVNRDFTVYHGDVCEGSRGEVFFAAPN